MSRIVLRRQAVRTLNVLIVEDEAIIAADLANRLRRLGHGVSAIVSRGDDAVRIAKEAKPDLVLMDIQLAGPLDGIDAAAIIRSQRDVPIIYLTAHSDRATIDRAAPTDSTAFVLKPFDESELQARIETVIRTSSEE